MVQALWFSSILTVSVYNRPLDVQFLERVGEEDTHIRYATYLEGRGDNILGGRQSVGVGGKF